MEVENGTRYISVGFGMDMDMLEVLDKKSFEKKFPENSTNGLDECMPVYLENGVILTDAEWNGEYYRVQVNGEIKHICPLYKDNGEGEDVDIVGYYER